MNKFYEQFITKDYGIAPKIMRGLFWATLGLAVFFLSINFILSIIFIILFLGVELICRKTFLEYEYEYFEGELTISKIMNKKNRKIIGNFTIEQISRVSKPETIDKSTNVIKACIKGIENNKELVLFIGGGEHPKAYYLSIDEKFFEILKREKPSIFNYI